MSTGRRVVIHIDELVLRGFRPEDRHAIAEGLQAELARLYAASPDALRTLAGLGSTARLRVGEVSIAPGTRPAGVGAQLATGIQRGIKP